MLRINKISIIIIIGIIMVQITNDNDKCAPDKMFKDGSCISLEGLILMANAYNEEIENTDKTKIKISVPPYPCIQKFSRITQIFRRYCVSSKQYGVSSK